MIGFAGVSEALSKRVESSLCSSDAEIRCSSSQLTPDGQNSSETATSSAVRVPGVCQNAGGLMRPSLATAFLTAYGLSQSAWPLLAADPTAAVFKH